MSWSSALARSPTLAPFQVRSFRYQWPSDLAASWAFEMETLILGWYVLVESGSVKLLVLFGALQYMGSLVSPMFGVVGDRVGYRRLLCLTRAMYALLALLLCVLAANQALTPVNVLVIAAIIGMVRPSDLMMRYALIAQTMPTGRLLGALGVSRITSDSARIAGALAGAGAVAAYGIAPAYAVVTLLYLVSFSLSLGVANPSRPASTSAAGGLTADLPIPAGSSATSTPSPLQDLRAAFVHVWNKPDLLGAMTLAFLVNLLAFPFVLGLLPYVAKNIYGVGQTELGLLVAAFSLGALLASFVLAANRLVQHAARSMLVAALCWFALLLLFAMNTRIAIGIAILIAAGFAQSLCLTPLAAVMLQGSAPQFRGRVMGLRLLAVLGLPAGLLLSGPLIEVAGFAPTTLGFAGLGLICTLAITWHWRAHLWDPRAPANHGDRVSREPTRS